MQRGFFLLFSENSIAFVFHTQNFQHFFFILEFFISLFYNFFDRGLGFLSFSLIFGILQRSFTLLCQNKAFFI
nr:hypothetical protein B11C_190077 [Bartonella sp. 1-1C]